MKNLEQGDLINISPYLLQIQTCHPMEGHYSPAGTDKNGDCPAPPFSLNHGVGGQEKRK